jgi:hypothetical protein
VPSYLYRRFKRCPRWRSKAASEEAAGILTGTADAGSKSQAKRLKCAGECARLLNSSFAVFPHKSIYLSSTSSHHHVEPGRCKRATNERKVDMTKKPVIDTVIPCTQHIMGTAVSNPENYESEEEFHGDLEPVIAFRMWTNWEPYEGYSMQAVPILANGSIAYIIVYPSGRCENSSTDDMWPSVAAMLKELKERKAAGAQ